MSFEHQQALAPYLLPSERLIWSGMPRQGIMLRRSDTWLIPFSLLWGGFAIFWNVSVWTNGAPADFSIFGIPLLVAGVYLIIGRFLHDAAIRRRQLYAVSDRRIFRLDQKRSSRLSSLEIASLPGLDLQEHRDGTASISFDAGQSRLSLWHNPGFEVWAPSLSPSIQFFRLPDGRDVYRLIARLRAGDQADAA